MNSDRVVLAALPAAVDDFLAAPLHFRVLALHGGEIEVLLPVGAGHARGRTAAEADQHRRAAETTSGVPAPNGGFSTCSARYCRCRRRS
jgi:hypothetical protein